jgi:Tol biopolymer transport system component
MNANGTGQRNLTPGPGREENAARAPDGRKIALSGDNGIYIVSADGRWQRNLTRNASDGSPVWTPDS